MEPSPWVLVSTQKAWSGTQAIPLAQTAQTFGIVGITLLPDNRVMYGHNLMNTASFYTPGFSLKKTWLSVAIERGPVDYTALRLSIGNGSQSWQQVVTSPGGAMPTVSFGAVMPTFPVSPFGTAYVDDFQIGYNLSAVPEPASWALLLAGGLGLMRLSRSRCPVGAAGRATAP